MVLRNLKLIMMINLSECKFGDKLRTRDGRMVLFLGECFEFVIEDFACAIKGEEKVFPPCFTGKMEKFLVLLLAISMT